MERSPRWVGGRFANVHEAYPALRADVAMPWREFFCAREERRPKSALPVVDPSAEWSARPATGVRVTWLGHSTLLVEVDEHRILTDPVWGSRASPHGGIGPKRFQPPPVPLAQLPTIDCVLISHDHYDHLDYRTIRSLAPSGVPFITPLGVGAHLERWGVEPARITELDWWETAPVGRVDLSVTATPAQHFSGRGPRGRNHSLWCSYAIVGSAGKVFFGGDSGLMPGFSDIRERFGRFDLVTLEIGAYHPAWGDIHMGPVNALSALELLGGGPLLPIHWGTFALATHRWDQPIEVLTGIAAETRARVLTPRLGEPVEPTSFVAEDGWWREAQALHPTTRAAAESAAAGSPLSGEATGDLPPPTD